MASPKVILLCQQILFDENRAQFNRVQALSNHFPLFIISRNEVSAIAAQKATGIFVFPYRHRISSLFFLLWALCSIFKIIKANSNVKYIYSTYEPRNIITSFIITKWFKLGWIVDLWDDPEKFSMISKVSYSRFRALNVIVKRIEFILARQILRYADKIVIGLVPEKIIQKYELQKKQFLSVTNGINLDFSFPFVPLNSLDTSRSFVVFYCGVVEPLRLDIIAPVFRELLKEISRIHFVVAGPQIGRGYEWLKDQLQDFSGQMDLEIKGQQAYENVLDLISKSDVCICPYPDKLDLATAYPVKIFDYMVMGRPVVASNLPGIASIITHAEDGLLFEPGDYVEMGEYLLEVYQSEQLRIDLSSNARKNVRRFSWEKINGQIVNFIGGNSEHDAQNCKYY